MIIVLRITQSTEMYPTLLAVPFMSLADSTYPVVTEKSRVAVWVHVQDANKQARINVVDSREEEKYVVSAKRTHSATQQNCLPKASHLIFAATKTNVFRAELAFHIRRKF